MDQELAEKVLESGDMRQYLSKSVILMLKWVSLNNSSSLTLATRAWITSLFSPTWGNGPCTLCSSSPTQAFIFFTLQIRFVNSSASLSKFSCGRCSSANGAP